MRCESPGLHPPGDAGIGGLQDLHTVADAVEKVADVAGAGVEAGRGEEVGRIVERAVDLEL